ncbi:hypothetical protein QR680_012048 [Steinernema hermaphroditum]|uniref:NADPH--cytochrome P450 reductase n=1 Tax=Steinernema hermaphroditum TaxID=289476 RepID=A0AA39I381_9BILA|nr:hypothetical protein QR680_012048 [Steinernema hermaphroditum]
MTDIDLNEVNLLTQATIAYDYLHANSTTHEHLFGAMAELVDNSRDAGATRLDIDFNDEMLYFIDDGCGMSKNEVANVVNFGHSVKRMDDQMIGQYGNGLKSGTMRIGKDFMLFTKKDGLLTALLLSRSFHEKNRLKKVFVPIPCFTPDRFPHFNTKEDDDRHGLEMKIIFEYSPFKDFSSFFQQFSYIMKDNGTVIVCFNLRRIENGALEMDLNANLEDIRVSEYEHELTNEVSSLRDYLSVLYSNPRMRIYLRGKKVNTCRLLSTLYKPRMYQYRAKNLKAYAAKEHEQCEQRVVDLKEHLRICRSNLGEFTQKNSNYMCDSNLRLEFRLHKRAEEQALTLLKAAEEKTKEALKAKSNPRPITFYFGLNILHRNQYGCLIYNNGRLITYYAKTACQNDKNEMKYLGVCGIVDVPYSVLEPTHNKQSFANKRDYLSLMKAFNEHMIQYWIDAGIEKSPGISKFWKDFGYNTMDWDEKTSDSDENVVYKRNSAVGLCVQCDSCLKWRIIDYQRRFVTQEFPEFWDCEKNPNASMRDCEKAELLPKIPEGKLTHAAKFSNTKRGLIQDEAEEEAQLVKATATRGRRRQEPEDELSEAEPSPSPSFAKSAPVRSTRKVCNFKDSDEEEDVFASSSRPRRTQPKQEAPKPAPVSKPTRRAAPVRQRVSSSEDSPPPQKKSTRRKSAPVPSVVEAPSLRKGTSSRPTKSKSDEVAKTVKHGVVAAPDSATSPRQDEEKLTLQNGTNDASRKDSLDSATRMIRRLLQINAPEGFDKMDALTMSVDELLRFDLDAYQKKATEQRNRELDDLATVLKSLPFESIENLLVMIDWLLSQFDTMDIVVITVVLGVGIYFFIKNRTESSTSRYSPNVVPITPANGTAQRDSSFITKMTTENRQVLILYGSQTGTGEELAGRLAKDLSRYSQKALILDPEDMDVEDFPRITEVENPLVVMCMATYGEGDPTDNAQQLHEFITNADCDLSGVRFSVFGLGNKTYEHYNEMGKFFDRRLEELGAERVYELGLGDDDANLEEDFMRWREGFLPAVAASFNWELSNEAGSERQYRFELIKDPEAKVFQGEYGRIGAFERQRPPFDQKNPFVAKIAVNRELHGKNSDRSCRHIEFIVEGNRVRYETGDHLAVFPTNDSQLVDKILALLDCNVDDVFTLINTDEDSSKRHPFPCPCSFRTAFTHYVDICAPVKSHVLKALAEYTSDEEQKARLMLLSTASEEGLKEYGQFIQKERRSIIDVLKAFDTCKPPTEYLLELLPRLQARYYSISSSPKIDSNLISITAVVTKYTIGDRLIKGVCTNYLLDKAVDANSPVFVRKSTMRLPHRLSTPIIMIGPGTGLAPFRGFLQERSWQKEQGKEIGEIVLYFGCRNPEHDYIYQEEMEGYKKNGVLSELHVAFSRLNNNGGKKVYVQNLLWENREHVWRMIDNGSHIYVCGDARNMARDVQNTFSKIFTEVGGKTEAEAQKLFHDMERQRRYQADVWS